jgi:hypothetical protein
VVTNSLTLDGVMQAPGRPDEDRRGGFEHGGWALPYMDPVMAAEPTATASAQDAGQRSERARRSLAEFPAKFSPTERWARF